jgi:hypothetical protein
MRLNNVLIVASFCCLLVSFWNRNALPGNIDYVAGTGSEPIQSPARRSPFTATFNDIEYLVEPEYEYDITGMVVSFRHHDEQYSRMHRLANDHLNMLDVCLVWGDNRHAMLDKLEFWNGLFTCNVSTRDRAAWLSFDMQQLSNNHLLSDDEHIRERVRDISVGDQIRVRGYLASYTGPAGKRGTSTTRTDTGDGACETLFIEDFDIVQPATNYWRLTMYASLAVLLIGLLFHFKRPYRPY